MKADRKTEKQKCNEGEEFA